MKHIATLLSFAIIGFVSTSARAADNNRPLDQELLVKASSCTNATIEASNIAAKRAQSQDVKTFAQKMSEDHKKCQDRLAQIVKDRKIAVVSGLEPNTKNDIEKLGKLQGAELDRAYLDWVIKGHREGIEMLQNQADNGKDNELRTFAKEQIPGMREHLKRAEELNKAQN